MAEASTKFRRAGVGLLTAAFLVNSLVIPGWAQKVGLKVTVTEGEGAINNIRTHTGHDPVVEVRDAEGDPISGASVTFQAPAIGPSAAFPGSQTTVVAQTNEKGQAAAHGLRPNSSVGPFQIRVTASYRGETASAFVKQTNAIPAEAKSNKKYWIIGALAAAGAGGVFAAAHGKGSSSSSASSSTTQTGVTAGSPSFGPPH